eukprot:6540097-Prymnesium_polylepis.1
MACLLYLLERREHPGTLIRRIIRDTERCGLALISCRLAADYSKRCSSVLGSALANPPLSRANPTRTSCQRHRRAR